MIRVRIWESTLATIRAEATRSLAEETGGHLFGTSDKQQIIVNRTRSSDGDKKRRFSFVPNARSVQKLIDKVWFESRGELRRVGTWHTHPGGSARPSSMDRDTAKLLAEEGGIELPVLLILATGRCSGRIEVVETRAWIWDTASTEMSEAEIATEDLSGDRSKDKTNQELEADECENQKSGECDHIVDRDL